MTASACREQPEGVVLLVQGVDSTEQVWLTLGAQRRVIEGPDDTESLRFASAQSRLYEKKPFKDGDEVLLDLPALQQQDEVAVVLDASVKTGGGNDINILRAAYAFNVESGVLNEVELRPSQLGLGQWVCAGKPGENGIKSFAVANVSDRDCDRDGWVVGEDPDDADPLKVGIPRWIPDPTPGLNQCSLHVGSRVLRWKAFLNQDCGRNCSESPLDNSGYDGCTDGEVKVRCKVGTKTTTLLLKSILSNLPQNPDWELARIGPMDANAVFAPSFKAPNEWSVTFALGGSGFGWFVLNDRAGTFSKTIGVEYAAGTTQPTCSDEL